jgi:hypothetical protein
MLINFVFLLYMISVLMYLKDICGVTSHVQIDNDHFDIKFEKVNKKKFHFSINLFHLNPFHCNLLFILYSRLKTSSSSDVFALILLLHRTSSSSCTHDVNLSLSVCTGASPTF